MGIWSLDEHSTWRDILRFAGFQGDREWVYIITGKSGPTGKTFLYEQLKKNGYNAIEISEDMVGLVIYQDTENHYFVDHAKKKLVIVLNKPINPDLIKKRHKRSAVEKAYNLLVNFRDRNGYMDIDEVIGYLGEALDD